MFRYEVTLGLPHTNYLGLAEHLLLAHAGYFQWASIASSIGRPLSSLRTRDGGEVYATFYFIEERFPRHSSISAFKLDDRVAFLVSLRAFKNVAVEGRILFDHVERLDGAVPESLTPPPGGGALDHPMIQFGNIFITPEEGNSLLKVAPPANADFSSLTPLPNQENPYHITKAAEQTSSLGLLDERWECVDMRADFDVAYAIDPDRDSNGAGLVYFANYVVFMDRAERAAMRENSRRRFTDVEISGRSLQWRRLAYYGNVALTDRLRTRVRIFVVRDDDRQVGFRYSIHREADGRLICLSESVKALA